MQTTRITFTGEEIRTRLRLRMARGTTFKHRFELLDENGSPFDLTGASIVLAVKQTPDTDAFIIRKQIVDGGENDFAGGKFVMYIAPEDFERVSAGWYVFGISLALSAGTFELSAGDLLTYEPIGSSPESNQRVIS